MQVKEKAIHIFVELKGHAPFTSFGALLGVVFMLLFRNAGPAASHTLFAVFHPSHVFLSAMVTASMFKLHTMKKHLILVLIIGYFGSVGIATLSDIVIPYFSINILGLDVPTHGESHHKSAEDQIDSSDHHEQNIYKPAIHLGFIEEWYIVNPAAFAGVLIAFFLPRTKFPHAAHVLISTWASSSYLLMNINTEMSIAAAIGIFATLFIAVWLPCCVSDIIFPLLFVKSDLELTAPCRNHAPHSHPHIHKPTKS